MSCCGTKVAAVATMSPSWRATCTVAMSPYRLDSDASGEVIGLAKYVNFEVECWEKDHDGLCGNGGDGAGMDGCYSFCHCYCPFVVKFNFLFLVH